MRIKNKKVLKNGAMAGYVYYTKEKKWKWRIFKGPTKKKQKGGTEISDIAVKCIQQKGQQKGQQFFLDLITNPKYQIPLEKILEVSEEENYIYRVISEENYMKYKKFFEVGKMPKYISSWSSINNSVNSNNNWNKAKRCGVLGLYSASWGIEKKYISGYIIAYQEQNPGKSVYILRLNLRKLLENSKKLSCFQLDRKLNLNSCTEGKFCLQYLNNVYDFIIDDTGRKDIPFSEFLMTEKFLDSENNNNLEIEITKLQPLIE